MQKFDIRALVLGGMFVSLTILLTYVFALHTTFVHITFGFVPIALYGAMYGPWKGALVGAAANLIGTAVLGLSIFFPGFTLSDFCTGWIYGYFFSQKEANRLEGSLETFPFSNSINSSGIKYLMVGDFL